MMAVKRVHYVEAVSERTEYWAFKTTWSYQHDRMLVLNWERRDLSVVELADSLGRTPGSVYAQAQKIGLPLRRGCEYHKTLVHVRGRQSTVITSLASLSLDNVRVMIRPKTARWKTSPEFEEPPIIDEIHYEPQTRRCLTCGNDFVSEWIGNRMCFDCREETRQML